MNLARTTPVGIAILALVVGVAGASWRTAASDRSPVHPDDAIQLGRQVYLAEGCVHCHSQFVRDVDPAGWGAPTAPEEVHGQGTPTPGNRRLGPDLARVGMRRSDAWQRVHLASPRRVSPGSTMPSYAHLFAEGDPRGGALVAYLASLRDPEGTPAEAPWSPRLIDLVAQGDPARGSALFASTCAACHGPGGKGLEAPPLPAPALAGASPAFLGGLDPEARRVALARLIREGRPGTGMPGHEALGDLDTLAVADHVLRRVLAQRHGDVVDLTAAVVPSPR